MAKGPVNQQVANQVLEDSLGMTMDDLGADRENAFDDQSDDDANLDGGDDNDEQDAGDDDTNVRGQDDGDDLGDGGERQPVRQPAPKDGKTPKADDLSVTHTPKDEFDHGKPKFDKNGNIIGSNGRVIATRGREARMYQTLHKTRENLNNTVTQANTVIHQTQQKLQKAVDIGTQAVQQLNALREVGQLHVQAGLNDVEFRDAIDLAAAFKKDKVGAIKTILTRAAASGIDLTSLGLQPGGFDAKSFMDLIRTEIGTVVKPIQDRNAQETVQQQQAREQQQQVDSAVTELNQFVVDNPEAKDYVANGTFARVLTKFPNMSLGEIWSRLQLNLLRRANEENGNGQRLQNRQRVPRLPSGRGNPGGGGDRDVLDDNAPAPVDQSYEQIAKDVMKKYS